MPKRILRRGNYYIKAKNEVCSLCNNGFGCCKTDTGIFFEGDAFNIDFTCRDAVRSLLATNLFVVSIRIRDYSEKNAVTIYVRKRTVGKTRNVCVFWSNNGCVLRHDIRPAICRTQTCYNMGKGIEYNKKALFSDKNHKDNWSYDEVLTILDVMKELKLTGKRTITKGAFEKIDMKHVLSIL